MQFILVFPRQWYVFPSVRPCATTTCPSVSFYSNMSVGLFDFSVSLVYMCIGLFSLSVSLCHLSAGLFYLSVDLFSTYWSAYPTCSLDNSIGRSVYSICCSVDQSVHHLGSFSHAQVNYFDMETICEVKAPSWSSEDVTPFTEFLRSYARFVLLRTTQFGPGFGELLVRKKHKRFLTYV